MYSVKMEFQGKLLFLAKTESVCQAQFYADTFKKRNPSRRYFVIDENGDIIYETE